jgi:hypothetical protein
MLFIGGSQDGKYIDVPNGMNEKVYMHGSPLSKTPPNGTLEKYRRVSISLCEMMVVEYLSVGEVIPRLMGHYRPEVGS